MSNAPPPPNSARWQPPTPSGPPTNGLAIATLALDFVCWPTGLMLGIVALIQIKRSGGRQGGTGIAIAAIAIPFAIIPLLLAIAVPNFLKFQCRSKQVEAKSNLRALAVAEESYRAE